MRSLLLVCLALTTSASLGRADFITVNGFNNNTPATVTFNDGAGHSSTDNTLLSQFNVTYTNGFGTASVFNTFSIDLSHTVGAGQTYAVNPRDDLAAAFANGGRIAYLTQTYGLQDLTNDADQAAALQIAIWDLSLNNHNPTSFDPDAGGTYSSGDPGVFNVSLGSNPDANQIAALTNQYLQVSIGATTPGAWFDAAAAGDASGRGESLVQPTPEPSALRLSLVALGCLGTWSLWRRYSGRPAVACRATGRGS
jgi:hypothetical protein